MTQKVRPVSDVSTGGWTPTPVYAQVNEATPDDGTFVTAPVGGGTFVVKLAAASAPAVGAGQPSITLTVRLAGSTSVLVELLQGITVVASRLYSPGSGFAAFGMTLTTAEATLIAWPHDPTQDPDLRVRVTDLGGGGDTCDTALSASPGVPFGGSYQNEVPYNRWWRLAGLTAGDYHITIIGLSGGSTPFWFFGPDCDTLTVIDSTAADGCFNFTLDADGTVWVSAAGSEFTDGVYVITVDAGDCP